ncbi:MAG TPA: DUF748 domain-containing protein [Bacteroidia bacterium]|nr:DUF748 domain-containing protein [Bacteroidia bacterium]
MQLLRLFNRLSKPVRWLLLTVILLVTITLFFISPLAHYLIEKNSKEWVGRKIELDNLYINLLTGNVEIKGLKCYEKNDTTLFLSVGYLNVNTTLYKFLFGTYAISDLTVDSFYVRIAQSNTGFNFDDLIPADDSTTTEKTPSDPIKYELYNINITNGTIDYLSTDFNNKLTFKDFEILSDGLRWDQEIVKGTLDYGMGKEGKVTNDITFNMKTLVFAVQIHSDRLDLSPLTPYFSDIISISEFGAHFGCDVVLKGNLNEAIDVALKGTMSTTGLFMTDPKRDTLFSFSELFINLDTVNLKYDIINIKSFRLLRPFVHFELYDNDLNNFTALMKSDISDTTDGNIELNSSNPFVLVADYADTIRSNHAFDNYSIDSLLIDDGHIIFNDYSLYETFTYDISQVKVWSDKLNSNDSLINISGTALLNHRGKTEMLLAFNPANVRDMSLYYKITDMDVSDMSPYSKYYVAHPFGEGNLTFESNTTIRNMIIDSNNKLKINRIKVGNKSDKPALYDLPLKLAIALLKDKNGNIDLDMPIDGDLNDPNYHLGKIIWNVIKNLIIKAVSAPYKLLASAFGTNEDELRELKFDYLQNSLTEKQFKQIDPLITIMKNKPELSVTIRQLTEPAKEEEQWAFIRAREIYFHSISGEPVSETLSTEQMAQLNKLTIKDSLFVSWVDSILGPSYKIVPIQQKVVQLAGVDSTRQAVKQLQENRNLSLKNHLFAAGADSSRLKIYTEDPSAIPPAETRQKFLIEFGAN